MSELSVTEQRYKAVHAFILEDNRADLTRRRTVDHVAVWSQAVAVVGVAAWTAVEHEHS